MRHKIICGMNLFYTGRWLHAMVVLDPSFLLLVFGFAPHHAPAVHTRESLP